jgi:hypothetical protein
MRHVTGREVVARLVVIPQPDLEVLRIGNEPYPWLGYVPL